LQPPCRPERTRAACAAGRGLTLPESVCYTRDIGFWSRTGKRRACVICCLPSIRIWAERGSRPSTVRPAPVWCLAASAASRWRLRFPQQIVPALGDRRPCAGHLPEKTDWIPDWRSVSRGPPLQRRGHRACGV